MSDDIPEEVLIFLFDLHDASRNMANKEAVEELYRVKFSQITDKYYSTTAWPDSKLIERECMRNGEPDDFFLVFYKEMTIRHLFTKLKPQLQDHVTAWNNYKKLFNNLLTTKEPEMTISSIWANDIIQEFVYHFQDFCQLRTTAVSNSSDKNYNDIEFLKKNADIWTLPEIVRILDNLMNIYKTKGSNKNKNDNDSSNNDNNNNTSDSNNCLVLLGYFAILEKARLECLLGDFSSSLSILNVDVDLTDKTERFTEVPSCHVSVLYHAGVSMVMMRKYDEAVKTLSDIILYVSRNLNKSSTSGQMKKIDEKSLALVTLAYVLCPSKRLSDQVMEQMESKAPERLRKLQNGDISTFVDIFEKVCPKFIAPAVPNYDTSGSGDSVGNACHETFKAQINNFATQVEEHLSLGNIRSYLSLYSSIHIAKLASLNDCPVSSFESKLRGFKHRVLSSQVNSQEALNVDDNKNSSGSNESQVNYFIEGDLLNIDCSTNEQGRGREATRFFLSCIKKNSANKKEIASMMDRHIYGVKSISSST